MRINLLCLEVSHFYKMCLHTGAQAHTDTHRHKHVPTRVHTHVYMTEKHLVRNWKASETKYIDILTNTLK